MDAMPPLCIHSAMKTFKASGSFEDTVGGAFRGLRCQFVVYHIRLNQPQLACVPFYRTTIGGYERPSGPNPPTREPQALAVGLNHHPVPTHHPVILGR